VILVSTDSSSDASASPAPVPVVDLLRKSDDVVFCGLSETTSASLPDALPDGPWRPTSGDPVSLKAALNRLPNGTATNLKTVNPFVDDGDIDTDAIRAVDGLDVDAVEQATGGSIDALARTAPATKDIPVHSHKDIVDPRRLALATLGFNTKFRWQIATDHYAIINPQDTLLPALSAFQKRGETDVFGRLLYDDFGGEVDIYMVFPSTSQELSLSDIKTVADHDDADLPDYFDHLIDIPDACPDCSGPVDIDDDSQTVSCTRCRYTQSTHLDSVTLMHGVRTGYSMRGDRAFYAEPLVFMPERQAVLPGVGQKRTRRHSGLPTDSDHERANGRTPMHEWFGNVYDAATSRSQRVSAELLRSRAITVNFEELPFDTQAFYELPGIPATYASDAADRAKALAATDTAPTLWALHISLLAALRDGWSGNNVSADLEGYRSLAQQLIQQPAYAIQVALREYDLQTDDDDDDGVLPDDQQMLSDAIEDLAPLDGITAETEADLSDTEAQQIQDTLQQTLNGLTDR
jgi:hypothetical protein